MQFFHGTKIDFVGKRFFFFWLSVLSAVVGIILAVIFPPVLGIDFSGGSEIAVDFHTNIHIEQVRTAMENSGLKGAELKSYGKENQYLIRLKSVKKSRELLENVLKTSFPNTNYEILKVDNIGPKIGRELGIQAIFAVLLSIIAILLYLAFRFEFIFGLGAVIALTHDVIFTFTFVIAFNHLGLLELELNQSIVAALLTVVGYSVNDTVIIFDRIRENRDKFKGFDFIRMVNLSINETLSRTVNTVSTVLLVLIPLIFIGGPVLEGFAFTMFIGIVAGTYSSVYVASSFVIWYLQKVKKVDMYEYSSKDEPLPAKA